MGDFLNVPINPECDTGSNSEVVRVYLEDVDIKTEQIVDDENDRSSIISDNVDVEGTCGDRTFSTIDIKELLSRIQLLETQVTPCIKNQPLLFQEVTNCKLVEERLNVLEGDIDERLGEINKRIDRVGSGFGSHNLCPCRTPFAPSAGQPSQPTRSSVTVHKQQRPFPLLPSPNRTHPTSQTLEKESGHVIYTFFKPLHSKRPTPVITSTDDIESTETTTKNFQNKVWPNSGEKFAGDPNVLNEMRLSRARRRIFERNLPGVVSRESKSRRTIAHSTASGLKNTRTSNCQDRTCPKCGKVCSKSSNLLRHIRLVHNQGRPKPYQCEFCKANYRNSLDLIKHQRTVHGTISKEHKGTSSEVTQCPEGCGLTFRRARDLLPHTNICQMSRKTSNENETNQNQTNGEKSQVGPNSIVAVASPAATAADESTSTPTAPQSLLDTSHTSGEQTKSNNLQAHSCLKCGKTCKRADHLLRHLRVHRAPKLHFFCEFCNAPFTRAQSLQLHTNGCRGRERQGTTPVIQEKPHGKDNDFVDEDKEYSLQCKFCPPALGLIFEDAEGLANHYTSQHPISSMLITSDSELSKGTAMVEISGNVRRRHMSRGKGNRGGTCTKCRRHFRNIRGHLQTHNDVRPFPCKICGKSFTRSHDLKRHIVRHTFSKRLKQKPILTTHADVPTVQRHGCDECGMYFPAQTFLASHKQTSHAKGRTSSPVKGEGSRGSSD